MAVTQISRIQHRRGLEQDLPQLSSAELGWSIDTRQLYIGNGTLDEGAPIVGVTRVLTEHDIATITSEVNLTDYTFSGNAAGYIAQTGPSAISPIVRTLQDKLDDFVNVQDFGAAGDGITDDTSAINRAIQQIYKSTVSPTESRARRTIYFPGGSYIITSPILIPPFARFVGDGAGSVTIQQTNANQSIAETCDSSFQTDVNIGTSSSLYPQDIEIDGLHFYNSNSSVISSLFNIDSASNVKVRNSKFTSNHSVGFYPNLVSILTSTDTSRKITFDSCEFQNAGNAFAITGTSCYAIRVINSSFENISNTAMHLGDSVGFTSIGNYYGLVGSQVTKNSNNIFQSFGDYSDIDANVVVGLTLGNLFQSITQEYALSTSTLAIPVSANLTFEITYTINNETASRFGTATFAPSGPGTSIVYTDQYTETAVSANANISANNDSLLFSLSSGTATLKFNFKSFN
jgi:hypothetical protein